MNTRTYNTLEQESSLTKISKPKYGSKPLLISLIILIVLFIGLLIFTIVYVVENENKSTDSSDNICFSEQCIEVSEELLSYMDESVNPCYDFFHFSCGGWAKQYEFELAKPGEHEYDPDMYLASKVHRDTLLSAIHSETKSYVNESSIQKIKSFYDSCYNSELNIEEMQSNALLRQFISMINFTATTDIDANWTQNEINGFQNAMSWLFQRGWNLLFYLQVFTERIPSIYQKYDIWVNYNKSNWIQLMENTFKPQFEMLFNNILNSTEINIISDSIINFTEKVANISTADPTYFIYDLVYKVTQMNYENIDNILGVNSILNYSQIIIDTFDIENVHSEIEYVIYLQQDIEYFQNLRNIISDTSPTIMQYFLYTNVLYYYLTYKDSLTQSRMIDRRDFCFQLTRDNFNYIYAYILDNELFGIDAQEKVDEMSHYILEKGLLQLLEETTWLDSESRANAIKKALHMGIYNGLPPKMRNISLLNKFYEPVFITNSGNNFVANYEIMLNFKQREMMSRFKDNINVDLITPYWPGMFRNTEFGMHWLTDNDWLTRVTAFYNPQRIGNENGNFFCMPWTISYKPFFDINYPSSINFGALGSIVGHEISHGFDPWGSQFNYNGTLTEIFSNYSRNEYNKKMECFIEQYNNIQIYGINETGDDILYVNGTNGITENSADNAGLQEAYYAWKQYINEHNDYMDKIKLPGIKWNNDQLFFIGYTRGWCSVWTDQFFDDKVNTEGNYYWNHSPRLARVTGVIQNSKEFANAFNCPIGTDMNPNDKCVLWE